jgi:hypothetical protein
MLLVGGGAKAAVGEEPLARGDDLFLAREKIVARHQPGIFSS